MNEQISNKRENLILIQFCQMSKLKLNALLLIWWIMCYMNGFHAYLMTEKVLKNKNEM